MARAIFMPGMMDGNTISFAAFTLRHNESYFSVARMAVDHWFDDIKNIPQSPTRQLAGYCRMNVGTIRAAELHHDGDVLTFEVEDKSTPSNMSHAGIVVCYANHQLRGDGKLMLKPLPENVSASRLLMKIQNQLVKIARMDFVMTFNTRNVK